MGRKWRPDPDKRKCFLLDCGHREDGGVELQDGRRIQYECPKGCGMRLRMCAVALRARQPLLPQEPGF